MKVIDRVVRGRHHRATPTELGEPLQAKVFLLVGVIDGAFITATGIGLWPGLGGTATLCSRSPASPALPPGAANGR